MLLIFSIIDDKHTIALDALSEKVFGYSDRFDVDYLHGLLANLVDNLNFLE